MEQLSDVFSGWDGYQQSLINAIAPRTESHLAWRPSSAVRSMGELARHIALGRVNWFMRMGAPGSSELAGRIESWSTDKHGNRYIIEDAVPISTDGKELARWLADTSEMIRRTLASWTVADLSRTYRHVFRGQAYDVSRQWTIWRIMAHDIHHGGQIARILAEQGIEAFELRALGGHITEPAKAGGHPQPERVSGVDVSLARHGGLSYLEIPASDPRRSARFYEQVIGWRIENPDTDRPKFSDLSGHLIGRWVDRPACKEPGLMPYIYVRRIHEVVSRVTANGGAIVKPPYLEGSLQICTIRDPAGNVIGLWQADYAGDNSAAAAP